MISTKGVYRSAMPGRWNRVGQNTQVPPTRQTDICRLEAPIRAAFWEEQATRAPFDTQASTGHTQLASGPSSRLR